MLTAAPTSAAQAVGKWLAGDIVYAQPLADGLLGWVCTADGDFAGTAPIFETISYRARPAQTIGALDIDWSLSNVFTKTLSAGSNTMTFSNAMDGDTIVVVLTGVASTVTWPTVQWPGGSPPTQTASGTDVYTFVMAGSTVYGSVVQDVS